MIVDVAVPGARREYCIPRIFESLGVLGRFFTDFYIGNKASLSAFLKVLPQQVKPMAIQRAEGRRHDDLPPGKVVSLDWLTLLEVLRKRGEHSYIFDAAAREARRFCRAVVRKAPNGNVIYAMNTSALEIFESAKARGAISVLDQASAPNLFYHDLWSNESSRWPGWEPNKQKYCGADPISERENREWQLADRILVPSTFVQREMCRAGVDPAKIAVVPLSVIQRQRNSRRRETKSDELHLLFVGSVVLMKGVQYLLKALRDLGRPSIKCRFVGGIGVNPEVVSSFADVAEFWGHLPRRDMADVYEWADVLVFPTLSDSFGMVQIEAMSFGLPVITTVNCGDIVRDGIDGYVVPIRDSDALAVSVERLLDQEVRSTMAQNARIRAGDFTFEKHARAVAMAVSEAFPLSVDGLRADMGSCQ